MDNAHAYCEYHFWRPVLNPIWSFEIKWKALRHVNVGVRKDLQLHERPWFRVTCRILCFEMSGPLRCAATIGHWIYAIRRAM